MNVLVFARQLKCCKVFGRSRKYNIFFPRRFCDCRHAKIGGDVLWRMVWLQGTIGKPLMDRGRNPDNEHRHAAEYALGDPPSHGVKRIIREEALDHVLRQTIGDEVAKAVSVPRLREELSRLSQEDRTRLRALAEENSKGRLESWKADTREQRIESLISYDVGQQDIGGLPPTSDSHPTSLNALRCAMSWVSEHALPCQVFPRFDGYYE